MTKVDFVPLTPEEIERIEIEELKHRMEIKEHQRMQRQNQTMRSIGQNDFVPQQAAAVTMKAAKLSNQDIASQGSMTPMSGVKKQATIKKKAPTPDQPQK